MYERFRCETFGLCDVVVWCFVVLTATCFILALCFARGAFLFVVVFDRLVSLFSTVSLVGLFGRWQEKSIRRKLLVLVEFLLMGFGLSNQNESPEGL